jgi:hypothetical protein
LPKVYYIAFAHRYGSHMAPAESWLAGWLLLEFGVLGDCSAFSAATKAERERVYCSELF